ncbi:hypothetical protein DUNSADRAFT_4557 [Dunaliella salina]|uniref:Uncharacterized protein n=1 Tax=Dunaliella salina TaxID=3046 RepID=A0ABQ7GRQ6_DUNSA|nr:hypothetical protein DUNSADRAFT_4557 [Dunaliella salina]|eukprot:KAF5837294.1 hypothetical protein DUNSADRAFT_4557 [Dunaliella salina]
MMPSFLDVPSKALSEPVVFGDPKGKARRALPMTFKTAKDAEVQRILNHLYRTGGDHWQCCTQGQDLVAAGVGAAAPSARSIRGTSLAQLKNPKIGHHSIQITA